MVCSFACLFVFCIYRHNSALGARVCARGLPDCSVPASVLAAPVAGVYCGVEKYSVVSYNSMV